LKKHKVLIVYPFLPLYRLGIFLQLNKSQNIDLTLVSSDKTIDGIEGFPTSFNKIFKWELIQNKWLLKNRLLWQKSLLSKFWRNDFSSIIILANPYHISTWVFAFFQRLKGKRIIFWTHGIIQKESGIKLFIRKIFLTLADDLLLYSHFSKSILIDLGFNANRLHVVYNSVYNKLDDFEFLDNSNCVCSNTTQVYKLIFIGRLTKQKKLMFLLEALKMLLNVKNKFELHIVGEGPCMEEMKNYVIENSMELYTTFYGAIYDENLIGEILAGCDLCVSPGEVGLTAIHCMQYGVPVITHGDRDSQMPEFEIIIPKKTGDFFVKDDLMDLSRVIQKWFHQETYNRVEIGRNCIQQVNEKYNPISQSIIIQNLLLND
jgi:glycosyltransferase involved in cell wall biosynthesis